MRLAVFGATGATGHQLVGQALALGHEVTALARRPGAIAMPDSKLRVVEGDVLNPGSALAAVAGADAVVSALGIGYSRTETVVFSAGTAAIIDAMKASDVRRFICVSSSGMDSPPGTPAALRAIHRHVLQRMLRHPYADMWEMERCVASCGLDWTIVRAARLTNSRARGGYRTAVGYKAGRGLSISRADLAGFMLSHLGDEELYGRRVEIAY